MKKGYLSQYFTGVATKVLSAVEVGDANSNQHEFNGATGLREILGTTSDRLTFETTFLFMFDGDCPPESDSGFMTWSDVRRNHPTRSEYHLYYSSDFISDFANAGDILLIAKRPNNTLLAIIVEAGTTISQQLLWLFGFADMSDARFAVRSQLDDQTDYLEFASRYILDNIGISVETTEEAHLEEMLSKFNKKFPSTRIFSEYARSTLPEVNPQDEHDKVLMAWLDKEEKLFRTLEKYFVEIRLEQGFVNDVDSFIAYSLSVQNRRKSRAGLSLENHLEFLFHECNIDYSRNPFTEKKSKPDFIFPHIEAYNDSSFEALKLTMLGVKSSCKDRWRQVLSEADRIKNKHLLTLEAGISKNQTDEMKAKHLQLVLPKDIHRSYSSDQQKWLMSVAEFTSLVLERQDLTG